MCLPNSKKCSKISHSFKFPFFLYVILVRGLHRSSLYCSNFIDVHVLGTLLMLSTVLEDELLALDNCSIITTCSSLLTVESPCSLSSPMILGGLLLEAGGCGGCRFLFVMMTWHLQSGQEKFERSQWRMHSTWKMCLQDGSWCNSTLISNSPKQTQHLWD